MVTLDGLKILSEKNQGCFGTSTKKKNLSDLGLPQYWLARVFGWGKNTFYWTKWKHSLCKQLAPCFILLLPKPVDNDAMYVHSLSPHLRKKHRQQQLPACIPQAGGSGCLTAMSNHSQVSQVNSVLLQVSHWLKLCTGPGVVTILDCVLQVYEWGLCKVLQTSATSHMITQKYPFHLTLEERFFLPVLTGNGAPWLVCWHHK